MCFSAVLQALASTLGEEELADLRDQFDAIDVDKNGSISLEEMRQVCCYGRTVKILAFEISLMNFLSCLNNCPRIFQLVTYLASLQALAKDLPWKMKDSRVLEILQAVKLLAFNMLMETRFLLVRNKQFSILLLDISLNPYFAAPSHN